MTFREFTDDLTRVAQAVLVRNAHGRTIPSYLHVARRDGRVDTLHIGLGDTPELRKALIETAVVPLVQDMDPEMVGWTFEGVIAEQDALVVVVIDRERAETWLAPLFRPGEGWPDETVSGTFTAWPANEQTGSLITPIQEALR